MYSFDDVWFIGGREEKEQYLKEVRDSNNTAYAAFCEMIEKNRGNGGSAKEPE